MQTRVTTSPTACVGALARRVVAVFLWLGVIVMPSLAWSSGEASSRQREWRVQELSWVKLVPAEAAAAGGNVHPASASPEAVRRALGSVSTVFRGRTETLFSNDELDDLVGPIVAALAAAAPGNDVEMLSTTRRHGNFMSTPYGVTARLFVTDAGLNVIVHDARLDFYHAYRATKVLPAFQYGSRRAAGPVALTTTQGQAVRSDWLVFPLQASPAAVTAPVGAAAAPAATAATLPAPANAAPARRDDRFYEEQEQRLRGLQRLRDQNLITEEEFQRKRREILQLL